MQTRHFVDPKKQTPEYVRAVEALKSLPPDIAMRAFAEATYAAREKAWAERYGLERSRGHACVARLLGKRCWQSGWHVRGAEEAPPCRPPGSDHADLWIKNGKPVVYTFQPYGLDHNTLERLLDFCGRWGLEIHIDTWPAGHFPGAVLWVEITPKGNPLWKLADARPEL